MQVAWSSHTEEKLLLEEDNVKDGDVWEAGGIIR